MVAPQRVETRVEIHARAASVFRILEEPESVASLAPGIAGASWLDPAPTVGSRILLKTRHGSHIAGRVVERREGRSLVLEDDRGMRSEWRLLETLDGVTLATNVLRGAFSDDQAEALRLQNMERMMRLVQRIESEAQRRSGQR